MKPRGQMLIVVAILLMVVLMILAVAVDGGRLLAERARLRRAAQAAADAGIGLVSEAMVTQAAARQNSGGGPAHLRTSGPMHAHSGAQRCARLADG